MEGVMPRVLVALCLLGMLPLRTATAADHRLAQAAAQADLQLVRQLLAARPDVNAPDADGTTALHWAVWADHPETVEELLRAGATATSPNAFGVTPIYTAAERGNARIIRRLLAAGAKANGTDRSGETLLMAAIRSGSVDAVTALVEAGADVNAADPQLGHSVLMLAVRSDSAPIVKLLLTRGASLEARTRVGPKPAVRPPGAGGGSHGVGIVRSGVPPQGEQLPAPGGMTPLLFAARDGSFDAARVLIEAGADVNAADPNGITPLMMAITNGKIPVAQLLVDKGADVRAADWYGRTPLWAAVEIRNLDMRSGATDNGIDRDGGSAADRIAHRQGRRRERTRQGVPAAAAAHAAARFARVGGLHRTDGVHPRRAVGRRAGDAAAAVEGRRPEDHDVQRHDGADGRGRRELGDRPDLQRVARALARGRAALPRARSRRERASTRWDSARCTARRTAAPTTSSSCSRAAALVWTSRTRKAARPTPGPRASSWPPTRPSPSRRRWR